VQQLPGYEPVEDPRQVEEAWNAWYENVETHGGLEAFLATAEARLLTLELPAEIAGATVVPGPPTTGLHDIQSRGVLRAQHSTLFDAEGDVAVITGIGKVGLFGYHDESVPIERHVQVLRELGFTEFALPNGKRYEIRDWPGVRRVRD
jgi:hypothetical protein